MPDRDFAKSRLPHAVREVGVPVPAMVSDRAVDFTIQAWAGRNLQDQASARNKCAKKIGKDSAVIFDVFDHLECNYSFEPFAPIRYAGVCLFDIHVGLGSGYIARLRNERRININRRDVIGQCREMHSKSTGSTSDFEYASADMGFHRTKDPAIVCVGRSKACQPG